MPSLVGGKFWMMNVRCAFVTGCVGAGNVTEPPNPFELGSGNVVGPPPGVSVSVAVDVAEKNGFCPVGSCGGFVPPP